MSLTKIGSIGINTGIAFAGVTTIVTLNTANDALSIGATVNVGSGITLGASGDIFATGVTTATTFVGSFTGDVTGAASQITVADESSDTSAFVVFTNTATGNNAPKTGSNLTFNSSSGALTATSFVGSGANLTDVDLVTDTSPQLGGNLDVNTKNIVFGDSGGATDDRLTFGAGTDLQLYHDGSHSYINNTGTGHLYIIDAGIVKIQSESFKVDNSDGTKQVIKANPDAGLEIYYDNSKRIETTSTGITISGSDTTGSVVQGDFRLKKADTTQHIVYDASNARMNFADSVNATFGDANDLRIYHSGSWNYIQNYESKNFAIQVKDTENAIVAIPDGAVQLYHNNDLKFDTTSTGCRVLGSEGNDAQLQLLADEGDDNADYWRFLAGTAGQLDVANYSTGSWVNHMTIDGNGVMTRPKTPSFSAHTTATASADAEVVFGAAVTAIGSHYSTSTGRFTAPVAGNYYFSFHGMGPFANSSNARCHFRINGAVHGGGQHYGGVAYSGDTGDYTHVSMDTILPLSANDYVTVYWEYMPLHAEHNKFNGFLIG